MPFKETCRVEERVMLMSDYDTGAFSVTQLCGRYGISRDTFYLWRDRRSGGGADWYRDGSHAPLSCPHRTPEALAAEIVAVKGAFPHFGPKKVRAWLIDKRPEVSWPAASTIGGILALKGLVATEARRRRPVAQGSTASPARSPNEEWCVDFKGWFRTLNGDRCDPLTITDSYSRYLIETKITSPTIDGVKPVFEASFRAYGLPRAIRCDNGAPFGSTGAGGLTRLSAWWLRLGVEPHFIQPASPQENGRHERFHRTLKRQTSRPPARTLVEQQARFDAFRRHYNEERPHEALDQTPPARCWAPSARPMPEPLPTPWYDADHQVRQVRTSGEIKLAGRRVFISEALVGQPVGIVQRDRDLLVVRFCDVDLGIIKPDGRFRCFAPLRHRLREAQQASAQQKMSTISPVHPVDHHPG